MSQNIIIDMLYGHINIFCNIRSFRNYINKLISYGVPQNKKKALPPVIGMEEQDIVEEAED